MFHEFVLSSHLKKGTPRASSTPEFDLARAISVREGVNRAFLIRDRVQESSGSYICVQAFSGIYLKKCRSVELAPRDVFDMTI